MSQELERFLIMFDGLVTLANDWIVATPKDKLNWLPAEGPGVRFGDRLTHVTIKTLYGHLALAEYSWVHAIRDGDDGMVLSLDKDPDIAARLESDDFLAEAVKLHAQCMEVMGGYTESQLGKKVIHTERTYSAMGFLWAMYAHHAYHLGNIDIYLRLSGETAPDFFRFHRREMA